MHWSGLDEFERFLQETPGAIAAVGTGIVDHAATSAALYIRNVYAQHKHTDNKRWHTGKKRYTGTLADRVQVTTPARSTTRGRGRNRVTIAASTGLAPVRVVRSGGPHTHLFEFGTQARHRKGSTIVYRGSPPHATFVPVTTHARDRMGVALVALVQRAGFTVSGHA